jgi:hypothetical protein
MIRALLSALGLGTKSEISMTATQQERLRSLAHEALELRDLARQSIRTYAIEGNTRRQLILQRKSEINLAGGFIGGASVICLLHPPFVMDKPNGVLFVAALVNAIASFGALYYASEMLPLALHSAWTFSHSTQLYAPVEASLDDWLRRKPNNERALAAAQAELEAIKLRYQEADKVSIKGCSHASYWKAKQEVLPPSEGIRALLSSSLEEDRKKATQQWEEHIRAANSARVDTFMQNGHLC